MERKNNKGLIILVVILIIMVLSLGGYIIYDEFIDNNKNNVVDKTDDNKVVQDTKEESILGDYVGTKLINIDGTNITTEVSMRLIDENNASVTMWVTTRPRYATFSAENIISDRKSVV